MVIQFYVWLMEIRSEKAFGASFLEKSFSLRNDDLRSAWEPWSDLIDGMRLFHNDLCNDGQSLPWLVLVIELGAG